MANQSHFHLIDYLIFAAMLIVSALTGVYFGCRGRILKGKSQDLSEYMMGNKVLRPFPVSMSLVASYVSAVTIVGTPAEIYNFGSQYWLIGLAIWISGTIVAFVFLPVFFKLQVSSSYEYLEMRFGRKVRLLASVFFIIDEIMFLPVIVFVPSLAFNQVTGVNVHLIGIVVCVICVFYTFLGGIKAVVYTDTFQIIVMFISVIVVILLGTYKLDGLEEVFSRCKSGNRLIFSNPSTSFYERHTLFNVLLGGIVYWTAYNGVNQTMVQRYLSLPTKKDAICSIYLFTLGVSGFVLVCCYSGLLIYATYYKCDPLSANRIANNDQILPLFVMEIAGNLHGIPGLFIAGVFGAGLSSLSVVLNTSSGVILEDFSKGCCRFNLNESNSKYLVKFVTIILGIITILGMFVIERLSGILYASTSLTAIAASTTFGMFCLGMLIPWSNSLGAFVGALSGLLITTVIAFGNQYVIAAGLIVPQKLPVSIENCWQLYRIQVNQTIYTVSNHDESNIFPLFRLSYHWITPIGIIMVILIGTIVSFLSGKTDLSTLDPDLISPVSKWMLPKEAENFAGSASTRVRESLANVDQTLLDRISTLTASIIVSSSIT